MTPYLYLVGAILAEVVGTTALNYAEGFTNPVPSIGVLIGYGASFYLLSLALQELSISIAYAMWASIGIVAVAVIGVIFLGEEMDTAGAIGIGLIIAGVFILNVVSNVSAH
jgi:small multidrug resistance pump